MTALGTFASQQRVVARRILYVAAGTAALVSAPQILSSIPHRDHRHEAIRAAGDLLQTNCHRVINRLAISRDTALTLGKTAAPALVAGLQAGWGQHLTTTAVAIADAIAGLGSDAERETVVVFGGPWLLDGLLDTASLRSDTKAERFAAQRALTNLLSGGSTAGSVLNRPGALPKLLSIIASSDSEAGDVLPLTLQGSLMMARLPTVLPFDDMSAILQRAKDKGDRRLQRIAMQVLAQLAEASVHNCGKLAVLGAGPILCSIAADTSDSLADRPLRRDLSRLMAVLARDSPFKAQLELGAWLQPLLFFAADAAAGGDMTSAARALDSFSSAASGGGVSLATDLAACNVLPLVALLWRSPDEELRRSLMTAVAAAVRAGGDTVAAGQREAWTQRMMEVVLADDTSAPLRAAAGSTLADLAAVAGRDGTAVAITWLGEVLISLSQTVPTSKTINRSKQALPSVDEEAGDDGETRGDQDDISREELLQAVGVVPSFARAVAAELSADSARKDGFEEPADIGEFLGTSPLAAYPSAADADDPVAADALLSRALSVLSMLVASDTGRQAWLAQAGAVPMLFRLTLGQAAHRQVDLQPSGFPEDEASDRGEVLQGGSIKEPLTPVLAAMNELVAGRPPVHDRLEGVDLAADLASSLSLDLRKQTARLLALLSTDPAAGDSITAGGWVPFLSASARSADCLLGSDASRALLNCRSAAAAARAAAPMVRGLPGKAAPLALDREELPPRCVLRDGVHLFSPLAQHHVHLADHGADSTSPGSPEVDIVFVHGIRGGAFATWRELPATQPPLTKSAETATAASATGLTSSPTGEVPGNDSRAQDSGSNSSNNSSISNRLGGGAVAQISVPEEIRATSSLIEQDTTNEPPTTIQGADSEQLPETNTSHEDGGGHGKAVTSDELQHPVLEPGLFSSSSSVNKLKNSGGSGSNTKSSIISSSSRLGATDSAPSPEFTKWQTLWSLVTLERPNTVTPAQDSKLPAGTTGRNDGNFDDTSGSSGQQQQEIDDNSDSGEELPPAPFLLPPPPAGESSSRSDAQPPSKWASVVNAASFGYFGSSAKAVGAPKLDTAKRRRLEAEVQQCTKDVTSADAREATAAAAMTFSSCWPATWLAADLPSARLLSLEYAAPASGWEGESLPVRATVRQMERRLSAAGVGYRPTIFVCHSLGGVLTKELLVRGLGTKKSKHAAAEKIAESTHSIVFYATPHSGTWMADWGWNLRYVGAAPDAVVYHLKPGPHLQEGNRLLKERCEAGALHVLSFGEGRPIRLSSLLPPMLVVPPHSATPDFGSFYQLPDVDHIRACKPPNPDHPAYAVLLEFLKNEVTRLRHGRGTSESNQDKDAVLVHASADVSAE